MEPIAVLLWFSSFCNIVQNVGNATTPTTSATEDSEPTPEITKATSPATIETTILSPITTKPTTVTPTSGTSNS